MKRLTALALAVFATLPAAAAPISILFVGNSYSFGRLDPVLTYNAANVRDLTEPQGPLVVGSTSSTPKFSDVTGTNSYPIDPATGLAVINPATGNPGNSYSPHSQTNTLGRRGRHFQAVHRAGRPGLRRGPVDAQRSNPARPPSRTPPTLPTGTCAATSPARSGTRWCCRSKATRRWASRPSTASPWARTTRRFVPMST